MRGRLTRLPPGGGPIGWRETWSALRVRAPDRSLAEGLQRLLGAERVTLHASGREALRVALGHLAKQSGRSEAVLPAYTCFSVAASAVAAGLRVRLVDVNGEGGIDPAALAKLPLERAVAVVVSNLLGLAEPIEPLRAILNAAGVALVDDAAQSIGARSPEGPVGGRGDVGLLSFGRGKPLPALGGGALAWSRRAAAADVPRSPPPRRVVALLRAAVYDLARVPWVFRALAAVPPLGVGETVYDPEFRQGGIDGASLCLAAALLPGLEAETRARRALAESLAQRVRKHTRFLPLQAAVGLPAYPRLGLIAPSERARDAALRALTPFGATRLYPSSLDLLEDLRPHRIEADACPGARDFAARLLTLPTHAGLLPRHLDAVVGVLERFT